VSTKAGAQLARSRDSSRIAIVLVAAVGDNGVIGRAGGLPWRLKSDMLHFRATTAGKPVVMGRKTYNSIGKPLKERTNIVVTRDRSVAIKDVLVTSSLDAGMAAARGDALRRNADAIMVIGGADIYAQLLPAADRLEITQVHLQPNGDATFPPIDPVCWKEVSRAEHAAGPGDDASFTILRYERIGKTLY
jgi:dihydrofolate reductase